jgi:hypothetical protein
VTLHCLCPGSQGFPPSASGQRPRPSVCDGVVKPSEGPLCACGCPPSVCPSP